MMKKIIFVLMFTVAGLCFLPAQAVESVITGVTIFSDRAQVTRSSDFELQSGIHTLTFTDVPQQIDQNSIQVKGAGSFSLTDVKLSTRYMTEIVSQNIRDLTEKKKKLEQEYITFSDLVSEAESEKRFIENISRKLTATGENSTEAVLDPEKWFSMVAFYRERLGSLNGELREYRQSAQKVKEEIDRITREIQSAGANQNRSVKDIDITIEMKTSGKGVLEVSYLVYGPTWYPDYTVRASGDSDNLNVMYQAFIRQSTGEDWSDAAIKLSTASPQVGGRLPELQPWYVNIWKPQPVRSSRNTSAPMAMAEAPSMAKSEVMEDYTYAEEPLPEMEYTTAAASEGTASVVFELSGSNTVESDNQTHKVTVAVFQMPADFSYSTVPKLSEYAFLQASVTNSSEFPMLPGNTHVFLDSNYVADGYMDQVYPGEKFSVSLGIDEGISVTRKRLNRFEETSGFFSKKIKYTYEYEIEVTSSKRTVQSISVSDQIPVSQNEDITVELITPVINGNSGSVEKTDQNIITWNLEIKPGETIKIPLKFSLEFPEGMNINGLE